MENNTIKLLHDIFIENLGYKNVNIEDFWKGFKNNIELELDLRHRNTMEKIFETIIILKKDYKNDIQKIEEDYNESINKGIKIKEEYKKQEHIFIYSIFISPIIFFLFLYFFLSYQFGDSIIYSIVLTFTYLIIVGNVFFSNPPELIDNKKINGVYHHFYSIITNEEFYNKSYIDFTGQIKKIKRKEGKNNLLKMNPYEFEKITADMFKYFGFSANVTKGSGDHGIDIHLIKNGEKYIVQCKRYNGKIGTPLIRDFIGTMQLSGINKGYFVTTASFSYEVVKLIEKNNFNIKLIDLETLFNLISIKNDGLNINDFDKIMQEGNTGIVNNAYENILAKKAGWDKYRGF